MQRIKETQVDKITPAEHALGADSPLGFPDFVGVAWASRSSDRVRRHGRFGDAVIGGVRNVRGTEKGEQDARRGTVLDLWGRHCRP